MAFFSSFPLLHQYLGREFYICWYYIDFGLVTGLHAALFFRCAAVTGCGWLVVVVVVFFFWCNYKKKSEWILFFENRVMRAVSKASQSCSVSFNVQLPRRDWLHCVVQALLACEHSLVFKHTSAEPNSSCGKLICGLCWFSTFWKAGSEDAAIRSPLDLPMNE